MLYKEIVNRKKLPMATFLLMMFCVCIYSYKFISSLFRGNKTNVQNLINLIIILAMIVISIIEIYKSSVSYKYSIIADQFIIHKIVGKVNKEVESVKFKNIKFIGREVDLKENYKVRSNKKYLCSMFNFNRYCCVYYDGKEFRKFYFQPSEKLLSKFKFIMNKDEYYIYVKNRDRVSV